MTALEDFLAEPRNVLVAAIRKDGRPQMTPNWFHWDGSRFYVSTTRTRAKYPMFKRDPRVQLAIDDSTGHRSVLVDGTVEILEDLDTALAYFRAIRVKHGVSVPDDDAAFKAALAADERVILAITPDKPVTEWRVLGL
ncbi:MAG: TIGR03618 family F420-dependent PPOX class oxidoreductase [Acidimicrobiia bacterium]